jgi:hypothetical protein
MPVNWRILEREYDPLPVRIKSRGILSSAICCILFLENDGSHQDSLSNRNGT